MPKKYTLPYSETGYFSSLICDYLQKSEKTKPFYHRYPSVENFKKQLTEKSKQFSDNQRQLLVRQLEQQYEGFQISEKTSTNIQALNDEKTFTVTTGHQLNLFTGPLYFLYKIISVLNLCKKLKTEYPEHTFVPVFWMASEDHDFEEIQYFNFEGKRMEWNRESGGAVGRMSLENMDAVFSELSNALGETEYAHHLTTLFREAYFEHKNLAEATRHLANQFFGEYGLVVLDGDDAILKKDFVSVVEKELNVQLSHQHVSETSEKLKENGYKEQVHPREINLFYLGEGVRERIIKREETYFIDNTELSFSQKEMEEELKNHPERFSPNALLRPVYQEMILPNLCYIGGGGELAYWLQLKSYFEAISLTFPIVHLRNSVLLVTEKQVEKLKKLDSSVEELFLPQQQLRTKQTKRISEIEIDFTPQREHLQQQFKDLYTLAEKTDASFIGAVAAQEKKQLNGLDNLEKRLMKAQKRKLADELERLTKLQDDLFPKENLQERVKNVSEFYLKYGEELVPMLLEELNPMENAFTIIELQP
ncbi:bacillithiol biosynthesis cysteine-adding enzyme BshC [Luteirhabdus pelagi]|uniref:bacillithiol biosynthesis cysteine-adding enzyme BshC n=1 Tax=Luteirhabdus pelagi TaxID=2792783 RepID=UPI00193985B3|nr:bacillithiol biosynthesis cysteine-adding enzyme BshC [Luteirhabdus pelagi]